MQQEKEDLMQRVKSSEEGLELANERLVTSENEKEEILQQAEGLIEKNQYLEELNHKMGSQLEELEREVTTMF